MINQLNFQEKDLELFRSYGIEVYKNNNGRFCIKPTVVETSARWEEAIKNAAKIGIILTSNLEIVEYNKK